MNGLKGLIVFVSIVFAAASAASAANVAVGVEASTLGAGVNVTAGLSQNFNLRLTGHSFSQTQTVQEADIEYDAETILETVGLLLDLHPGGRNFRVSLGAMLNNNRVELATEASGIQTVNGRQYDLSLVGVIDGEIQGSSTAPYIGLGWGNPVRRTGHWGATFDLGVLYQGDPEVTLTPHPTNPDQVPAQFYVDLEQERQQTEKELSSYKYFPVVSFGLSYRF